MKKFLAFFIISFSIFSKDVSITLKESGLNRFLDAARSFSEETGIDFKFKKYTFTWKVYNAKIELLDNASNFKAKVDIITRDKTRKGTVEGKAKFIYDGITQKLKVNIENLKVKGLDIFDLAGFYKPKYELPIEIIREKKVEINRSKDKKVFLSPSLVNESVTITKGQILIEADLKFAEDKKK